MSEVTLHPLPRWRDVVVEQIRVVGLSLRPVVPVMAVVLAIGTLMIGGEILSGGKGFDSSDTFMTPLVSFILPFAVWRNEKRFGPSFLWTFPVDRQRLALAKVFAGFVWLIAALALFSVWLFAMGVLAGLGPSATIMRIPYIATIATYLFGSAVLLGLRYPLRWLFGAAGLFFLIGGVSQFFEEIYGVQTLLGSSRLYYATQGTHHVWRNLSGLAQWSIITVLSLGVGLAALFAALSRHRERRRR